VRKSKFAQARPKVGERVVLTFKGKREGASGAYNDYDFIMPERKPFEPDWGAMDLGGEP
jgi:hypothetical protein